MNLSPLQLETIRQQIGREPRGIINISAQSPKGTPLVLQMRSLIDNTPFPTLYWLSSDRLGKLIGQIEGKGWVKEIEARLQEDNNLRNKYLENHKQYVTQRWNYMLTKDKKRIEELGFTHLFEKYGIGGISQWDKVRCLHMQYAHHLVDNNVIGAIMDEEFGLDKFIQTI